MSEIYGDVRTKHIKLDIVGLSGDFLARAKRRTLKEMNRRDGDSQIASSVLLLVEFWCQDVARILPIFAKIPGPTVLAVTPANPRDSFLSGERQISRAAPVDALRGNARDLRDCERLTLLPLPSLIYWWLCLGLWTTQKPVKRVTWDAPPYPPDCFSGPLLSLTIYHRRRFI